MATVNELLAQYAGQPVEMNQPGNTLNPAIRQQEGLGQMNQMDQDAYSLTPLQLTMKYGQSTANQLMNQRNVGRQQLGQINQQRNSIGAGDLGVDLAAGVGSGFANSIAGIGALGLGAVNAEAGTWAAGKIQEGNQWVQENVQSDALDAARQINAVRNEETARQNKWQQQVEDADASHFTGLRRIGRDAIDAVGNALEDPLIASEGSAQAVGSLLAGGPISKGLKAIGKGVINTVGKASGAPLAAAHYGGRALDAAAMPAAIGLMESGGVYQQTASSILGMTHEQLMQGSEDYQALIAQGMLPNEAKQEIANNAGQLAAAITAPAAIATGTLVAGFEASPFAARSVGTFAANLLKEPIEEGIQSGAGQVAQNYAVKETANKNQDMLEGVGEQVGLGALYGFTAAGAVQAPGSAARTAGAVGKATMQGMRSAGEALWQRGNKVIAQNNEASPVSDINMATEAAAAVEQAPVNMDLARQAVAATDATPVAKQEADSYLTQLDNSLRVTQEDIDNSFPELADAYTSSTNKVELLQNLANVVESTEDTNIQLMAAISLYEESMKVDDFRLKESEALDKAAADSNVSKILTQYQNLMSDMNKSPKVMKAVKAALNIMNGVTDEQIETVSTPEDAAIAAAGVVRAEQQPGSLSEAASNNLMLQNTNGVLNLTPSQVAALRVNNSIFREATAAQAKAEQLGLRNVDIVNKQVTTDDIRKEQGTKSALTHSRDVISAMRAGNPELAKSLLSDFGMFAKHMQNKLSAANTHYRNGDSKAPHIPYMALMPDRTWKQSAKGSFVNLSAPSSIEFVQTIDMEAQALTNIYNGLVEAFPELGMKPMKQVELDSALVKNAKQIVKEASNAAPTRSDVRSTESAPSKQADNTSRVSADENVPDKSDRSEATPVAESSVGAASVRSSGSTDTVAPLVDDIDLIVNERAEEAKKSIDGIFADEDQVIASIRDGEALLVHTRNGNTDTIVATVDGEVAGSLTYEPKTDVALTTEVEAEFARRRIAEAMYRFAAEKGNYLVGRKASNGIEHSFLADGMEFRKRMDITRVELSDVEERVDTELTPEQQALVDQANAVIEGEVSPMDQLYPELSTFGEVPNRFKEGFKVPKEAKTTIIGNEAPLSFITDLFKSTSELTSFIGSKNRNLIDNDVIEAYTQVLKFGDQIKTQMEGQLKSYLDAPYSKGNPIARSKVLLDDVKITTKTGSFQGSLLASRPEGLVLNITENQDGKLVYNQPLLETAVLAMTNWIINSNTFAREMDEQSFDSYIGVKGAFRLMDPDILELLQEGMSAADAKRSLAQQIKKYWGMSTNNNVSTSFSDGIAEAVASELLRTLVDNETITVNEVRLDSRQGLPEPRTFKRYVIAPFTGSLSNLHQFPDAIERAVMVNPEPMYFIGDEMPVIAKTQMNNPIVENTPDQMTALEAEAKTPFYVHMPMVNFLTSLGSENILRLFGVGNDPSRVFNVQHQKSVEGKNRSLTASYDTMLNMVMQMHNRAEFLEQDVSEVPIRFGYNMSVVGRMQQLGAYGPQASKMAREVLLPTFATIDLNNDQMRGNFMIGIAQHLGIKVHNKLRDAAIAEVQGWLDGGLAPAVELLTQMTGNNYDIQDSDVQTIQDSLKSVGADLTFGAMNALIEYGRSLDAEDSSKFRTPLYLEADGMTNGPINAMGLFTTGSFTPKFLKNIGKGGVFFGQRMTANEYRSRVDKDDLYKETANNFVRRLAHLRNGLKPKEFVDMDNMLTLLNIFNPDLKYDGTDVSVERGITKNPLTITIYGSGERGIAENMASALIKTLYEHMSTMASAQKANSKLTPAQAMFGIGGEVQWNNFLKSFNALTRQNMSSIDPVNFEVTPESYNNLRKTLQAYFVAPMRDAIGSTVGESLMDSVSLVQKATQIQSIYAEQFFKDSMKEIMDSREARGMQKTEFLSKREMDSIYEKMEAKFPFIKTGKQTFFVAGSSKTEVPDTVLGSALNGEFRTPAQVYGPADAGVAGIPFLTIGMGDGMMMQNLANMGLEGTLKIFDGMNMPIDQIMDYSEKANQAVFDSWQANPLAEVGKAFDASMASMADIELTPESAEKVTKALDEGTLEGLSELIKMKSAEIDARHTAMRKVAMSVDQMAAAGSPYMNSASIDPAMTTDEKILEALNDEYRKALAGEETVVEATTEAEFPVVGRALRSGVRILSTTALQKLGRGLEMTDAQRVLFGEIMRSGSIKDYKVVVGTHEQIREYQTANGKLTLPSEVNTEATNGYLVYSDKTVYIASGSAETVVHELIHAATFERVLSHYQGDSTVEVAGAVTRIEELMNQYLNTPVQTTADMNARAAINESLIDDSLDTATSKAKALNEFMAWTLSNVQLSEAAAKRKAPALVQLAKDAFRWLKNLIWGRKVAPKVGEDALSNLQFNTGIIIRSQPTSAQIVQDTISFQSEIYGDKARVTELGEMFDRLITSQYNTNTAKAQANVRSAAQNAIDVSVIAEANHFNMTPQERNTFNYIFAALQTEVRLDSTSLNKAQQVYTHVLKNARVEHFMPEGSTHPADRYMAQKRYDVVAGNYNMPFDDKGRSSLLPMFLALSMTNDVMRDAMSRMEMPSRVQVDSAITNVAGNLMQSLSNKVTGVGNATNIRDGIDGLMNNIEQLAQNAESDVELLAGKVGGLSDRTNAAIVAGIENLADKTINKMDQIETNTNNSAVQLVARTVKIAAQLATESEGEKVAMGLVEVANKMNLPKPLHDFVNDLVGRTAKNSGVYDMIKQVRSMVQQFRQQFRENLPNIINKKFTRTLSQAEWNQVHMAVGKTDASSLLGSMSMNQVSEMYTNNRKLAAEISSAEQDVRSFGKGNSDLYLKKIKQLSVYMTNGIAGSNLLRNAFAISRLYGETKTGTWSIPNKAEVASIDKLASLYAIQNLSQNDKSLMADLFANEKEGMDFTLSYLTGLRATEQAKAVSDTAKINQYKGYVPTMNKPGTQMIVANDSEYSELAKRSFIRVADYNGSSLENVGKRGYYFAPVTGRAAFNQGIFQNVRQTVMGVDSTTGFSIDNMSAGRITEVNAVRRLTNAMKNESFGSENLMPIYNAAGKITAFERSLDPDMLRTVAGDSNLSKMIGVWRGRQVEEMLSQQLNETLIDKLKDQFDEDTTDGKVAGQYINLMGSKIDPVYSDAVNLLSDETRDHIEKVFGKNNLPVRKDMISDAVGYRNATVGDVWSGNSRWSPATRKQVEHLAISVFGNKAYQYLVNGERILQNFVQDARTLIVVKSVVVPISNILSNFYQLVARGVPLASIVKNTPRKLAEIHSYGKSRVRLIEAEAELLAAQSVVAKRKLENEIQSIKDSHKRLSIWPLIEAGEFTAISDAGVTHEETELTSGRLYQYIEQQVNKLPKSVRDAGRYALITKDTALYQGLQKSIQYGDFIAKALMYDDLMLRQQKDQNYTMGRITEEFVNYDRLPGRTRGYLESVGLLWFWNFKIRSAKVGLSMIRNNPLHTLLAVAAPTPTTFGSVGLPVEDNLFAKMGDGSLDYSVGLGQAFRAPMLNPWVNLID